MKKIIIEFIPHIRQRYSTCGDYHEFDDHIHFWITDMGNATYSMAILLHELLERHINTLMGVTDEMVDDWDMAHLDSDDPGWIPGCVYLKGHSAGDVVERLLIRLCGEAWPQYEKAIDNLEEMTGRAENGTTNK